VEILAETRNLDRSSGIFSENIGFPDSKISFSSVITGNVGTVSFFILPSSAPVGDLKLS
jgi:hypothetical protein